MIDKLIIWIFSPYLQGLNVLRVDGFGKFLIKEESQEVPLNIKWYKGLF